MAHPGFLVEVACGTGYSLDILVSDWKKINYIGLDLSLSAVREAKQAHPDMFFAASSILSIPLNNHSVDFVICYETLEHLAIKNQLDALNEISRVLKPKGIALFSVPSLELHIGKENVYHIGLREDADWADLLDLSSLQVCEVYGQNPVNINAFLFAQKLYSISPLLGRLLWLPIAYYRPLLGLNSIEKKKSGKRYRNHIFVCQNYA